MGEVCPFEVCSAEVRPWFDRVAVDLHDNHATGRPAALPDRPGAPVLAVLEVSLSARLKVLLRFLPVEDVGLVRVETFFPPVNNPLGHDPIGEPVG